MALPRSNSSIAYLLATHGLSTYSLCRWCAHSFAFRAAFPMRTTCRPFRVIPSGFINRRQSATIRPSPDKKSRHALNCDFGKRWGQRGIKYILARTSEDFGILDKLFWGNYVVFWGPTSRIFSPLCLPAFLVQPFCEFCLFLLFKCKRSQIQMAACLPQAIYVILYRNLVFFSRY